MQSRDAEARPARLVLVVLAILTALSIVLGIATGVIDGELLHRPIPSPSDPITVP